MPADLKPSLINSILFVVNFLCKKILKRKPLNKAYLPDSSVLYLPDSSVLNDQTMLSLSCSNIVRTEEISPGAASRCSPQVQVQPTTGRLNVLYFFGFIFLAPHRSS